MIFAKRFREAEPPVHVTVVKNPPAKNVPSAFGSSALTIGLTATFIAIASWQVLVRRPRILARRHALEAARDPLAAARRRRREKLRDRACVLIGGALGLGLVVYAEFAAGHL